MKKRKTKHFYILPSGEIVNNQLEGCTKLGIGRNAFRNRVKSGIIKHVMITDKPNGYYNEETVNSTLR